MVKYLSLKIARHGAAISRLRWDVRHESGEIGQLPEDHALAFDAADFVWAYLAANGVEGVAESRALRNRVAEAILDIFGEMQASGHLPPKPWATD
jgi:hypothetical protein